MTLLLTSRIWQGLKSTRMKFSSFSSSLSATPLFQLVQSLDGPGKRQPRLKVWPLSTAPATAKLILTATSLTVNHHASATLAMVVMIALYSSLIVQPMQRGQCLVLPSLHTSTLEDKFTILC